MLPVVCKSSGPWYEDRESETTSFSSSARHGVEVKVGSLLRFRNEDRGERGRSQLRVLLPPVATLAARSLRARLYEESTNTIHDSTPDVCGVLFLRGSESDAPRQLNFRDGSADDTLYATAIESIEAFCDSSRSQTGWKGFGWTRKGAGIDFRKWKVVRPISRS